MHSVLGKYYLFGHSFNKTLIITSCKEKRPEMRKNVAVSEGKGTIFPDQVEIKNKKP
jgi:hypothetical protein